MGTVLHLEYTIKGGWYTVYFLHLILFTCSCFGLICSISLSLCTTIIFPPVHAPGRGGSGAITQATPEAACHRDLSLPPRPALPSPRQRRASRLPAGLLQGGVRAACCCPSPSSPQRFVRTKPCSKYRSCALLNHGYANIAL